MRARAIREGSVGLLILIGLGLFGGLVLWLRGLNPGSRDYQISLEFDNTAGMQVGTAVRYRGVAVGRVVAINPSSNTVAIQVQITEPGLRIPRNVLIEANQSGFIGETTIDITPLDTLSEAEQGINPAGADCDSNVIICDGDMLPGEVGISYESLLRSAEQIADIFSDPELIEALKATLQNTEVLTAKISTLTDELTELTVMTQAEIQPLATAARQATDRAGDAAEEIQLTATDVRRLLSANQTSVVGTLANLNQGSDRLLRILTTVDTVVSNGEIIADLEQLSTNAAAAAENLRVASADVRELTSTANTAENRLLLQQTLESARDVFQSAQKILSDVDELTGDPQLRDNLRNLINGLSNLLSSTQMLEQQVALADVLQQLDTISAPVTVTVPTPPVAPTASTPLVIGYRDLQTQLEAIAATEPRDRPGRD
jgi:phospholipid/cholesterol/gamma-HCH transport system substrate-binding protein